MHTSFYRRNLPHQQPPGAIFFITFSLAGAIPAHVIEDIKQRSLRLKHQFQNTAPDNPECIVAWKRLFRFADECMDKSSSSFYLSDPRAAKCTVESITRGQQLGHYILHRYCVMGNHVHLLIEPMPINITLDVSYFLPDWPPKFYTPDGRQILENNIPLDQVQWRPLHTITKAIKRVTSPVIAEVAGAKGQMWMEESFDHWIRNGEEYKRVIAYIDNNPVAAALCKHAEDWPWSTAAQRKL